MSLAKSAPVNSALLLSCFLQFQTLHLLSGTTQIHPEASSSRKPSLICKSLILTLGELWDPGTYQGGLFHCPACSVPLRLQGVSASV